MRMKVSLPTVAIFLILTVGCQSHTPEGQSQAPPATQAPATAPQTPPPATAAPTPPSPTAPPPQATQAAPAPSGALASQQSNWPGVVVDVTEFRRKGSTLTARVVLRNQGGADVEPEVHYNEVYVMDLGAGKKYEVLKDEKGTYIAALRSGWGDRWYGKLKPGETYTLWMKLPAPPADVKSVTLQIPGLPPFEDLAIQDS